MVMDEQGSPTQRAADKWDSPRFSGSFNASAESCSQALSASCPLAANANRWAIESRQKWQRMRTRSFAGIVG